MAPTLWQSLLLPASFRGVPFVVLDTGLRGGRRIAFHEFPFRDIPWSEDLGRRGRQIRFSGYVVGDDASIQAFALQAACEVKGPGPLVHPTKGFSLVACAEYETEERWDRGRVVSFRFTFLEAGQLLYPTTGTDTQAASRTAANNIDTAANSDLQVHIDDIQLSQVNGASAALKGSQSGLSGPVTTGAVPVRP